MEGKGGGLSQRRRKGVYHNHTIQPRLIEYAVLNPPQGPMREWRMFRIEYGFECGCPEGTIWLPPEVDVETFERYFDFF